MEVRLRKFLATLIDNDNDNASEYLKTKITKYNQPKMRMFRNTSTQACQGGGAKAQAPDAQAPNQWLCLWVGSVALGSRL